MNLRRKLMSQFIGDGATALESRTRAALWLLFALGLATVVSIVPVVRGFVRLTESTDPLTTKLAPRALQSLTLFSDQKQASQILNEWKDRGLIEKARAAIGIDQSIIPLYTLMFICAALLATAWAYLWTLPRPLSRRDWLPPLVHLVLSILLIGMLAIADVGENKCLQQFIDASGTCSLGQLRLMAQLKFTLLGVVGLCLLLAVGIGLRRQCRSWQRRNETVANPNAGSASRGAFRDLVAIEYDGILREREGESKKVEIVCEGSEEPKVIHASEDFVGLALSGGGIRSATFNLGLLQGLHRFNLLRHVDFLATVSGGGYIGGFWSRWLRHHSGEQAKKFFPDQPRQSREGSEPNEIRHLREFSNFLVPRTGVFDTETWGAVVAMLASVLPALVAALSVLGVSLVVWLVFTFYLACPERLARVLFGVVLTATVLIMMERWWRSEPTGEITETSSLQVRRSSILAVLITGALAWFGMDSWPNGYYSLNPIYPSWSWRHFDPSYANWWLLMGILQPQDVLDQKSMIFIPRLYEPSIAWGLAALLFLAIRFRGTFLSSSIQRRVALPIGDRTVMRLLGLATGWAVVATFWQVGIALWRLELHSPVIGGAAGTAGLFALLRNWIGQNLVRPHKASLWEKLKPYVPQLLAYSAVGLAWAAIAGGLIKMNQNDWLGWYQTTFVMGAIILLVLFVDPHEFGLHAVYRDRICRAFLGAAYPGARTLAENRQTDFQPRDDIRVAELKTRPLHLICCAANNLSGDHLSTLSRGGRSAALSRNGVALGNSWVAQPFLQLGSALTASAAAFNSNMGSVSMRVGPAVSFLMSALNLRLGLWVTNPAAASHRVREPLLPGLLFYKEMGAGTNLKGGHLHLSDGAHFDNLGLYELVRRHCRYIIVSDCTADPEVAFDDFGNTARRIREDFGIEIEIDLEPLRPSDDGLSPQHVAVGAIHYDGTDRLDKGILLYFKPGLTGDEPRDVLQYHKRNDAFPHEATGDQFYDEAQWESYRRLGEHAAHAALRFLQRRKDSAKLSPQDIFSGARHDWFPTPPDLPQNLTAFTGRYSELESLLLEKAPQTLMREFFPELNVIAKDNAVPQPMTPNEVRTTLHLLLKMIQLMEDVWLGCRLDTHWNHPLNLGWTNLFQRWTGSPSFRMWWPVLKPLYGSSFVRFLEEQRRLSAAGELEFSSRLWLVRGDGTQLNWQCRNGSGDRFQQRSLAEQGIAWQSWEMMRGRQLLENQVIYSFELRLPRPDMKTTADLQVALAIVTVKDKIVSWNRNEFFILPSLWGAGIGGSFLREIVKDLGTREAVKPGSVCQINLPDSRPTDPASRNDLIGIIDFYKAAQFRVVFEAGAEKMLERRLDG